MELRSAMDQIRRIWAAYIHQYAGEPILFSGPRCGVHVRKWKNPHEPTGWSPASISLECDPGYCGIGAAMDPEEAHRLGEALIRAAVVAAQANLPSEPVSEQVDA